MTASSSGAPATGTESPRAADVIEAAWVAFHTKQLDRADAVNQIRAVIDVTEIGAAQILDDEQPSRKRPSLWDWSTR